MNGFILQMFAGTLVTLKLAVCALMLGMTIGLIGAILESTSNRWVRYVAKGFIFLGRGLPELLVLFFIYFGMTAILSKLFHQYIEISSFTAGVVALAIIFGSYASQVFRGAFLAVDQGQKEAGLALGLNSKQIFLRIQLPQAWRHALPGLGNLWMVLLKDTAIVTLIGLTDLMGEAKIASSTTLQPFTFYLAAAGIYLVITYVSHLIIQHLTARESRYIA